MEEDIVVEDKLNRLPIIKNLTTVLDSINVENGSVIGIDSPWGTGKTTFLKLWKQYLKQEKNDIYAVSYFNAWENDDSEDPLISLLIKFESLLSEKEEKQVALDQGKALLKNFSEGTIRLPFVNFKFYINKIIVDMKDSELTEIDKKMKEFNNKVFEFEKMRIDIKKEFKNTLKKCQENLGKKIIIFIDELDRCRPTFSIEMLEVIKHLFNIENIIFVLAWDKEQLSHSICNIYGNNMDSLGYLRRFIDMDYRLSEPSKEAYLDFLLGKEKINEIYYKEFFEILLKLVVIYNMSLRDIDKLIFFLKIHFINIKNMIKEFSTFREIYSLTKAIFICLKIKEPNLYERLKNYRYSATEVVVLLKEMKIKEIISILPKNKLSFASKHIDNILSKILIYPFLDFNKKDESFIFDKSEYEGGIDVGRFFDKLNNKNIIFEEIEFLNNFIQSNE